MTVRLGISTYAYTWRMSELVERPLTLDELVVDARRLGLGVLQICDHPPLEAATAGELARLRAHADASDVALEVGTRGIGVDHLLRMLDIAIALGSPVVRSMLSVGHDQPTTDDAVARLLAVVDAYADAGVALGLETYEQVPTATLLEIVRRVGRPQTIGICLDPANPVAGLEHPRDVVERCAPVTVNVHVKDFAFTRAPGWVGFTYSGARFGDGALDYEHLVRTVRPVERGLSQIVEHWVTWPGSIEEAVAIESEWTDHAARALRAANHLG